MGCRSPCRRTVGAAPAVTWRSEPPMSRSFESNSGIGIWISSSCWTTVLISLHHPCDLFDGGEPHPGLFQAVIPQRHHPLLDRDSFDLVGGGPLDSQTFDLFTHLHHFVEPDAPAVARVR